MAKIGRIYLDHAATTPVAPEVKKAMEPWLADGFGNPSSLHAEGRKAKAALDQARERVSKALECEFAEVVFTSGGTEAAHLALIGLALGNTDPRRNRILVSAAEHHCVLHTANLLARMGVKLETTPVDRDAQIDLNAFEKALGEDVLAVSVMTANNELGTLNPIPYVVAYSHKVGALVHSDAVQTFLKPDQSFGLQSLGVDLVTVSAHKVRGPKGVGALAYRAGTKLKPIQAGGGQERELRAGTENVAGIVGFGVATALSQGTGAKEARDAFEAALPEITWSVSGSLRLDTHSHGRVPGIDAETLLIRLDREGISASSGAACSSGSIEPSHVLLACGYSEAESKEGLRFTFGGDATLELAHQAADRVKAAIEGVLSARR